MVHTVTDSPEIEAAKRYFGYELKSMSERDRKSKTRPQRRKDQLAHHITKLGTGIYTPAGAKIQLGIFTAAEGWHIYPKNSEDAVIRRYRTQVHSSDYDYDLDSEKPKFSWAFSLKDLNTGKTGATVFQQIETGELGVYSDLGSIPVFDFFKRDTRVLEDCENTMRKVFDIGQDLSKNVPTAVPYKAERI